jgi:uncharacterized protein YecT (DUF1311 family)
MKTLFLVILLITSGAAAQTNKTQADCTSSPNQGDLNDCAVAKAKSADQEMNRVYRALLAKYKKNAKAVAVFRAAQRAWLRYKDAELRTYGGFSSTELGSVYPMCASLRDEEITRERIKWLRAALEQAEGDVCTYPEPAE